MWIMERYQGTSAFFVATRIAYEIVLKHKNTLSRKKKKKRQKRKKIF